MKRQAISTLVAAVLLGLIVAVDMAPWWIRALFVAGEVVVVVVCAIQLRRLWSEANR